MNPVSRYRHALQILNFPIFLSTPNPNFRLRELTQCNAAPQPQKLPFIPLECIPNAAAISCKLGRYSLISRHTSPVKATLALKNALSRLF